jgi:hypothetical protein
MSMEGGTMNSRILALVLTLGLIGLPAATPAAATGVDMLGQFDAVILVSEADLPALLDSGALGEYTLVSAAEVGLDEAALISAAELGFDEAALITAAELGLDPAALVGPGLFAEDTVLTPDVLGLDTPDRGFFPCCVGFSPFFCCRPHFNNFCCQPVFHFRHFCCQPVFHHRHHCCAPFFNHFQPPFFGRVLVIRTCC